MQCKSGPPLQKSIQKSTGHPYCGTHSIVILVYSLLLIHVADMFCPILLQLIHILLIESHLYLSSIYCTQSIPFHREISSFFSKGTIRKYFWKNVISKGYSVQSYYLLLLCKVLKPFKAKQLLLIGIDVS